MRKAQFPLSHDLDLLLGLVQDAGVEVPPTIAILTPYAVQTRYPGEWEDISDGEVTEALDLAEQAAAWARPRLTFRGHSADEFREL
ncbi:MAG: HEPN domain-containing protein [Egibacteraceae bacterium]